MADSGETYMPTNIMESQLSTVELIRAMYPPTEDDDGSDVQEVIDRVREWCENPSTTSSRIPCGLNFTVTIPIAAYDNSSSPPIQMNVSVPLTASNAATEGPAPVQYSLRQPPWLSRAEVAEIGASMPSDDIFAAFDYIQDHALPKPCLAQQDGMQEPKQSADPLLRVWFYFPSLSTREKRKDLVTYAASYNLTGFVLAGKPGVLCLEGTSRDVDDYMNAIKNESWGDIPSHQKKVSERFREEVNSRKFDCMTEITDALGERRGARKNRGDMAALEAFLKEKGVGESFSRVIMG